MTKVAFTGGRDGHADEQTLDELRVEHNITRVIVGDARGVDTDVYFWAKQRGIPVRRFEAKWDKLGKLAGHARNQQMIKQKPKKVLAFAGGRGTRDMTERAREANIEVVNVR